jgi:hypothetical protein
MTQPEVSEVTSGTAMTFESRPKRIRLMRLLAKLLLVEACERHSVCNDATRKHDGEPKLRSRADFRDL